ncbi:hypothetical protein CUQ99_15470 [Acinetobacter baumannii]|nr:hypothetical protein [Acinetobacter baumannii]
MDQHTPIDYRLLVDNLTTAILLIDSNFNIFYLNSACEALFDISLLRASGQPVLNLLHAPDDTFNSVHDKFHRTLILSGFCLLKIAKISLNSSFFPKPIKR